MIPKWMKEIAKERINILMKEAEKEVKYHSERSKRYVELARKIGMRYKVRIPRKYKRRICPNCHAYLKPGVNCTVRLDPKNRCVVWKCLECGHEKRYPYYRKKLKRKSKSKRKRRIKRTVKKKKIKNLKK